MRRGPGYRRLAAELAHDPPRQGARQLSVVAAVVQAPNHAAQTAGRAALCTVTWQGENYPATYPDGYTPVAGHLVLVAFQPPQTLAVIHRLKIAP